MSTNNADMPSEFPGMKKITIGNFPIAIGKNVSATTKSVVFSALRKKADVFMLFDKKPIFLLRKGPKRVLIHNLLSSLADPVGINIARDKNLTKKLLENLGYPTPKGIIVDDASELMQAADEIGFPLVVKPTSSAEGKGVTVDIRSEALLRDSFEAAKKFGRKALVEKQINGDYYRITYVADGSFAATKNLAAFITGDGLHSAEDLIEIENDRNRERRPGGRLKKIKISGTTERFLASNGYSLKSVIPKGKRLPICFSGYGGGEYIDATDSTHPYYIKMARAVADRLGLPIVSIDIIAKSIAHPLDEENEGSVIEINGTSPSLDFHKYPTAGTARDLAPHFVDYLLKNH